METDADDQFISYKYSIYLSMKGKYFTNIKMDRTNVCCYLNEIICYYYYLNGEEKLHNT